MCYLCLGMKPTDPRPPCFSQESLILETEGKPATAAGLMLADVRKEKEKPWNQLSKAIISETTKCGDS